MYTSQLALALLASTTSSLALPTDPMLEKRGVAKNTQSCTAQNHGLFLSYSIDIGVTYDSGKGCGGVYEHLENSGGVAPTNWQCVDDGNGDTQLWFNAPLGQEYLINSVLHGIYPTVNGFNCPGS